MCPDAPYPSPESRASNSETRILLAEDEWLVSVLLRQELERQGFQVIGTAGNGQEAVDLACRLQPDVVLMDVQMPQMDGLTATRTLMERCPTCVVLLTGKAGLEAAAERAGAMHYVLKPLFGPQIPSLFATARHRFLHYLALRAESPSPQDSLAAWQVVVSAVKLLLGRDAISEDQAFHRLQRDARDRAEALRITADRALRSLLAPPPALAA
jgi:AmiR/NasT family two-component response regulator